MRLRFVVGTVLYLVAIVAPVAGLYVVYGPSTTVDANSMEHMIALASATLAAFVLSLGASRVSQPKSSSPLDSLAEILQRMST